MSTFSQKLKNSRASVKFLQKRPSSSSSSMGQLLGQCRTGMVKFARAYAQNIVRKGAENKVIFSVPFCQFRNKGCQTLLVLLEGQALSEASRIKTCMTSPSAAAFDLAGAMCLACPKLGFSLPLPQKLVHQLLLLHSSRASNSMMGPTTGSHPHDIMVLWLPEAATRWANLSVQTVLTRRGKCLCVASLPRSVPALHGHISRLSQQDHSFALSSACWENLPLTSPRGALTSDGVRSNPCENTALLCLKK